MKGQNAKKDVHYDASHDIKTTSQLVYSSERNLLQPYTKKKKKNI